MQDYLIFRLYGPMASWGEIAVGEYRPSYAHPSKSAVLGLMAAALGLTREDESAQSRLAAAYAIAIRVHSSGTLLQDYHTVQTPGGSKRYDTRKDELKAPKLHTILSTRDYRCDAFYTVYVWPRNHEVPYSLDQIVSALQYPVFTLYLGRKSCPVSFPLLPKIRSAASLKGLIEDARESESIPIALEPLSLNESQFLYWDSDMETGFEGDTHHQIMRRDMPLNRKRWQFQDRIECYVALPSLAGGHRHVSE